VVLPRGCCRCGRAERRKATCRGRGGTAHSLVHRHRRGRSATRSRIPDGGLRPDTASGLGAGGPGVAPRRLPHARTLRLPAIRGTNDHLCRSLPPASSPARTTSATHARRLRRPIAPANPIPRTSV
jgi:hypothetical protein